jgi:hypothetical protein
MKKAILLSIVFVAFFCGCTKEINTETGETTWKLNPIISQQVEDTAEGAAGLLTALTPFIPHAGVAGGALLTALGIYRRKVKPNFDKAKTEANLYHTATHTLVEVIEDIKKNEPEVWAKIKPLLETEMGQNIENAIRAIRGLPPKE